MGRKLSSSFGLNSTTADMEYHANATAAPAIVAWPSGVGAVKCAQVTGMSSGQSKGFDFRPGTLDFMGIQFLFRTGTRPTANNTILRLSGAGSYVFVKETSTGTLELSDEDGVIGTSAGATSLDTDYRIDLLFDKTAAGGSHIIRLYVNGSEVAGAANRNISATPNSVDFGANRSGESQTVGNWYFTGIKINDNTGSDENGLPSTGYLAYARPIANGDANVNASRGGADSGADWSQLDEETPNDATDYMELTSTTSAVWVTTTKAADLGIGGAYIIKLVQVGGRITLASAVTGNWWPAIKSQSGGAVLEPSAVSLASATWFTHDDTTGAKQYKITAYKDPQTNGAWQVAALDTMQIGAKTNDGSPATRVSALWAIIEYIPFTVVVPTTLKGGLTGGLSVPSGGLQ